MSESSLGERRVTFIGGGNMAEALIQGLVRSGLCPPDRITVTDVCEERLRFIKSRFGVTGLAENAVAVRTADVVILAVKPQVMDAVLIDMKGALVGGALVISIAAGVRASHIEGALGEGIRVVRCMPNTPALVGEGAAAVCGGRWTTDADLDIAEVLLGAVGQVVRVDETAMDAVTALSGSGPAYVFYLAEALLDAAARMGLNDEDARSLTCATLTGAAKLLSESDVTPGELRERVTSKGGTTAAALEVLSERGVHEAVVEAVLAAQRRSRELCGH